MVIRGLATVASFVFSSFLEFPAWSSLLFFIPLLSRCLSNLKSNVSMQMIQHAVDYEGQTSAEVKVSGAP